MQEQQYNWEVPEINLNLRNYTGSASDVIKQIKFDIEKYLSKPGVSQKTKEIYSAIYCALDYYKTISYSPAAEFSTNELFLSNSINTFNEDYKYLSDKYYSDDPTDLDVIDMSARIKSPLGFVEKVKEKINEYLEKDRDLSYFTESLRDLIGVRIVVNPPKEIEALGPQAESDYLYNIFCDLMNKHGILRQNAPKPGDFNFIPVNTRHNKSKLEFMKKLPKSLLLKIKSGEFNIFIPSTRIAEMDNPAVDSVVKDYNMHPNERGYQSLHVCVVPDYSKNVELSKLPNCIIPQKINNFSIEYQFRTRKQHEFAELGPASHKFNYKPHEATRYHRLSVPLYIDFDDYSTSSIEPSASQSTSSINVGSAQLNSKNETSNPQQFLISPIKTRKFLKLRNFAESFKKFYGQSFKDFFNIEFNEFRDKLSYQERNDILAGKKSVQYDENGFITLIDTKTPIFLEKSDTSLILGRKDSVDIEKLLEDGGITDNMIAASPDSDKKTSAQKPSIQLYSVETSSQRDLQQDHTIDHSNSTENIGNPMNLDDSDDGFDDPNR